MADEPNDNPPKTEPKKPAVSFDTEGEFVHAVEKRAEKKIRAAEKAARDAVLAELGVESDDDIASLKALRETSGKTKSEVETLQAQAKKLAKELADARKAAEELHGFKVATIRDGALRKHAGKFRDYDDLVAHAQSKVVVGDDGTVDEKALEAEVENLLKAKPHLRATDYKGGAGTTPAGARPANGAPNGKPLSLVEKLTAAMQEHHAGGNTRS